MTPKLEHWPSITMKSACYLLITSNALLPGASIPFSILDTETTPTNTSTAH
jgi:hypothetical protein